MADNSLGPLGHRCTSLRLHFVFPDTDHLCCISTVWVLMFWQSVSACLSSLVCLKEPPGDAMAHIDHFDNTYVVSCTTDIIILATLEHLWIIIWKSELPPCGDGMAVLWWWHLACGDSSLCCELWWWHPAGDGTHQAFLLVSSFERRQCGRQAGGGGEGMSEVLNPFSVSQVFSESGFQSLTN